MAKICKNCHPFNTNCKLTYSVPKKSKIESHRTFGSQITMSKRNARRSLMPTNSRRLAANISTTSDNPRFASTTDQSDEEWDRLQRKVEADARMADIADAGLFEDSLEQSEMSEENLGWHDNMPELISMKGQERDKLHRQALEMQSRFMWDLSLAVKRMLVAKNIKNPKKEEKVAMVDVRGIVNKLETEPPYPTDWEAWIDSQYADALADD